MIKQIDTGYKPIHEALMYAQQQAKELKSTVQFEFNRINIFVDSKCDIDAIYQAYFYAHTMGWSSIGVGHERTITQLIIDEYNESKRLNEIERVEAYLKQLKQPGYIVE